MASFLKKHTFNILSRDHPENRGLFLKRIGTLLEEGYSIKEALIFLEKIENKYVKQWIVLIQEGLLKGSPFHKELEKVGFSSKVCAQIFLAEQYGNYGRTIAQCGENELKYLKTKNKFKAIASYPFFLLIFLFAMLMIMRFTILPHMENVFKGLGSTQELYSNKIVLFVYYSPQIIVSFLILMFLGLLTLNYFLKEKTIIQKVNLFMQVPILHAYLKDYYSHFFFAEWGSLFKNGCSFQEILNIMKSHDSSNILKETGGHLVKQMKKGVSVHHAISTLPFFYEEGIQVISHGENLGKLGTEMLIYAEYCEHQLSIKIEKLMERMQPIIFCLVATMILAIYAALMLPVFTIMEGF